MPRRVEDNTLHEELKRLYHKRVQHEYMRGLEDGLTLAIATMEDTKPWDETFPHDDVLFTHTDSDGLELRVLGAPGGVRFVLVDHVAIFLPLKIVRLLRWSLQGDRKRIEQRFPTPPNGGMWPHPGEER